MEMALPYTIRARDESGPIDIMDPLPMNEAVLRAKMLHAGGFDEITFVDAETGGEMAYFAPRSRGGQPNA